jgi:thioredoxin 1
MMTSLVQVTDNSFDAEVLKCDILVLAEFWADWCAPCQELELHLADIANNHDDQLKIVRLNIEANPIVTSNYTVLKVPTVILFKNGQEVDRITGTMSTVSKEDLLARIEPFLDR